MKKRFLNLLLALALVVCVLPMAADAASCGTHNKNNTKLVPAKAATCVTPGNIEHYVCEACGKTFVAKNATSPSLDIKKNVAVPATSEHNYVLDTTVNDGYREGDEATCTETGIFVLKCSTAGCTATTAQLAPVDKDRHTPVKGICSGCGACVNNHVSNEIITSAKPATCTEPGAKNHVYQCKVCKIFFCNGVYKTTEDFPENVIPATNTHDFSVWKANVTPATCTKREVERYQCKTCTATEDREVGNLLSSNGAHTPGKMLRYIARPTCQATGEAEYECTVCDENVIQVVRKLNCNIVDLEAKAPTCILTGLTAGKTCTICDDTTKNQNCAYCASIKVEQKVVDALGHDHVLDVDHVDYKPADCDNGGVDVFDCTRCGYDNVHVTTLKLNHDWDNTVINEATCTIDGMSFQKCKREGCGQWSYEIIDATGHNKVVVDAVAPTCTATGLTAGEKCSACGEVFTAQSVVEKIPHAWEDVEAQDPTCKADGYNAHKACSKCGETDGKTVIAAGAAYHEFENFKCKHCGTYDPSHQHEGTGVITTESTCTAEGVKTFECDDCDHTWTEAVAKKPHTYNAKARCTECGALDSAHQHNYVQTAYRQPTCTVEGKVTKKCSVCDELNETIIDSTGHSYVDGKCTGCGIAAACEHANTTTTVVSDATCNRAGQKVTTCDNCGKTVGTEVIPATGNHNYVNNRCTGCGKNNPNRLTIDFQDVFIVG